MAVLVTKPGKYAKCICCGSDTYDMHEFQFFKDIGMKTCITLCKPCVYQMANMIAQDTVDKLDEKNDKRSKNH